MGGFSGDRQRFSTGLGRIWLAPPLGQGVAGELQWWKRVIITHVSSCQHMKLLPGGWLPSVSMRQEMPGEARNTTLGISILLPLGPDPSLIPRKLPTTHTPTCAAAVQQK